MSCIANRRAHPGPDVIKVKKKAKITSFVLNSREHETVNSIHVNDKLQTRIALFLLRT